MHAAADPHPRLSYRIPQSDPPLELRDNTPRAITIPTDPAPLYRGILTLSSRICGEQPPEKMIYERRQWPAFTTDLQLTLTPRNQGLDSKVTFATACQTVRGIGEYLAEADIRYSVILQVWSQEEWIATAVLLYKFHTGGGSQNGSAVDVA